MSGQSQHSENPDIQWALDLLRPDPDYQPSVMQKYMGEIICMGSGLALACIRNYFNRRPMFAGVQLHAAFMATGYVVAQVLNKVIDDVKAEHDTRLRTYVMLHPELFPKPEQVKYGDILEPWTPIR